MGLVAPWHVGSSQTRARTRVACIGRQILNHCATREAPVSSFVWGTAKFENKGVTKHKQSKDSQILITNSISYSIFYAVILKHGIPTSIRCQSKIYCHYFFVLLISSSRGANFILPSISTFQGNANHNRYLKMWLIFLVSCWDK